MQSAHHIVDANKPHLSPHRTFRSAFRLITAWYPSENSTRALFIAAFLPSGGAIIRHFSPFRFIAPGMFPRGPQEYR